MQQKYIYASYERLDNLIFAYGIDQTDFVKGIKKLPTNIVSLSGVDDTEHPVNAHTGLNMINDENEIRRYLLQTHTQPLKWMDFHEATDLDFLTPTEIAELLYLGHMDRPIRTSFNYKLRNKYVFLEQRNGGLKIYFYYISQFHQVLNASIIRHTLETYRTPYVFLRSIKVPAVPAAIINQLIEIMPDGLLLAFDQSSLRQRRLTIPVLVERENDAVEVFEPTRAERNGLHTKQVAALTFELGPHRWHFDQQDQTYFANLN